MYQRATAQKWFKTWPSHSNEQIYWCPKLVPKKDDGAAQEIAEKLVLSRLQTRPQQLNNTPASLIQLQRNIGVLVIRNSQEIRSLPVD